MKIINGKLIAKKIRLELKKKISASRKKPRLAVILIGNDPASRLYVSLKEKACKEVGIDFQKAVFPDTVEEKDILALIKKLNSEPKINGILIQLPLPKKFNASKIIWALEPKKDVDGFHPKNVRQLKKGKIFIEPVLAKAIFALIKKAVQKKIAAKIKIGTKSKFDSKSAINPKTGLKTLIVGKSDAFTEPLESYLKQKGFAAKHTHFKNYETAKKQTSKNDIVIIAIGSANLFSAKDFKEGAIIIDVGINKLTSGRIVGDVNFDSLKNKNVLITPVPGGVGPVTVAMLLENVYLLKKQQLIDITL